MIVDESEITINGHGHASNHAAMRRYVISAGTTVITEPLQFPDDAAVIGAGIGRSIIDARAVDGVAMYAPGGASVLDGFTILGSGAAGTVGIQADNDHRIYGANWGKVGVRGFATGINFVVSGAPSYFNHFDVLRTSECGIGLNLDGLGESLFFSASHIGVHFADNCEIALRINGAERMVIGCIQYEICHTGIKALKGAVAILGGGIEDDTPGALDFDISDDFGSLIFWGTCDTSMGRVFNNGDRPTVILPDKTHWMTSYLQGRLFSDTTTV